MNRQLNPLEIFLVCLVAFNSIAVVFLLRTVHDQDKRLRTLERNDAIQQKVDSVNAKVDSLKSRIENAFH